MKKILLFVACTFCLYTINAQTKIKFYTTLGDFVVELNDSLAPITAGNFKSLVSQNYYDGISFHRVIKNFMIQGGAGASRPAIADEFHASLSNVQGTISMANTGQVNSGTTQFFINLVDNIGLDYNKAPLTSKHPVFGKVTENFSVVQAIGNAPVIGSSPNPQIIMDSVRVLIAPEPPKPVNPTLVKFYTTLGDFIIQLEDSLAPITSGNFKTLVIDKYYDGVSFHRVINGFMIQGGNGGFKPNIQDEFHDSLSNVQGTISMANTGRPNSGNTQFFINLVNNTRLDYNKAPLTSKHPVFGHVIENFSVVQDIGKAPVNGSTPNPPIIMDSLRIYTVPKDTSGNGNPKDTGDASSITMLDKTVNSVLFRCFPNPISRNSKITLNANQGDVVLRLIDLIGNEVSSITMESSKENQSVDFQELSSSQLEAGIYFIEGKSNEKHTIQRILVQ